MEYRHWANAWLPDKVLMTDEDRFVGFKGTPSTGPLKEVWEMLYADKVQNKKDFELYNANHPRAARLKVYFSEWLKVLRHTAPCIDSVNEYPR